MNNKKTIHVTTIFPDGDKLVELISFDNYKSCFLDGKLETDRHYNKVKTIFDSVQLPTYITSKNPFDERQITKRFFNFPLSYMEAENRYKINY